MQMYGHDCILTSWMAQKKLDYKQNVIQDAICRDEEDHRKQPQSYTISIYKLSYCYCTRKAPCERKDGRTKLTKAQMRKEKWYKWHTIKSMLVGNDRGKLSTREGSLFPGGAKKSSEQHALVLTGERRRERKPDNLYRASTIKFPLAASGFAHA